MFVSSFGYGTSKREGMEARHKGIRPLVRSPHTERQRRLLLLSLFSFVSNTVTVFCFGPLSSLSQTRRDSEARKTVPKTGYVRAYNVCCPAKKRYTLLADVGD